MTTGAQWRSAILGTQRPQHTLQKNDRAPMQYALDTRVNEQDGAQHSKGTHTHTNTHTSGLALVQQTWEKGRRGKQHIGDLPAWTKSAGHLQENKANSSNGAPDSNFRVKLTEQALHCDPYIKNHKVAHMTTNTSSGLCSLGNLIEVEGSAWKSKNCTTTQR